jgi:hypothetical protein
MYSCKQVETKEILSFMWKYTSLFNGRNVNGIENWLKSAKVSLVDSPIKKINNSSGEKVQVRSLYVLKDKYLGI